MTALVRQQSEVEWELREAWATGRRVTLLLDADEARVEGRVERVAASGAYVAVAGLHVPLARILAVRRPSRLGDSTAEGVQFDFEPIDLRPAIAGQLEVA